MNPLTIVALLIFVSFFISKIWPRVAAILLLLICSNPLVANLLIGSLEKKYEKVVFHELPQMDVLIVLSGMSNRIQNSDGSIDYEFNEAVDRINAGIELMKLGKADKLILTRGLLPWSRGMPEGEFLEKVAINSGLSQKQIELTNIVENTEQELLELKNKINKNDVVGLITSAFHMNRALFNLNNLENDLLPIPVDYRATSEKFSLLDLFPSTNAIQKTSLYWKEQLGLLKLLFFKN